MVFSSYFQLLVTVKSYWKDLQSTVMNSGQGSRSSLFYIFMIQLDCNSAVCVHINIICFADSSFSLWKI